MDTRRSITDRRSRSTAFSEDHPPGGPSEDVFLRDLVDYFYKSARSGIAVTVINAVILAVVLWPVSNRHAIVAWLSVGALISAVRMAGVWRFNRGKPSTYGDYLRWYRFTAGAVVASALFWGSVSLFLFPAGAIGHQVFIAFVVGGMSAGAASTLTARFRVGAAFIVISLLPAIVRLAMEGDYLAWGMAAMLGLFMVMMLVTARRSENLFVHSLSLRNQNTALLDNALVEKTRAEELTAKLLREIEERRQAEETLRDREQHLRSVVDSAPVVLASLDPSGKFLFLEGKGLDEIEAGVNAKDLIGRSVFGVFRNNPTVIAAVRKALRGQPHTTVIEILGRSYETIYSPVKDAEGRLTQVIGVSTDITELLKLERQKENFLTTVSHELRTPLTSLVGALRFLQADFDKSFSPEARELLEAAERNLTRLVNLAQDMADLENLSWGRKKLDFKHMDLRDVLTQACEASTAFAAKQHVNFVLEPMPEPLPALIDPERLGDAVRRLLGNAVNFSPVDTDVVVRAYERKPEHTLPDSIRVEIADRGAGVPFEDRQLIFESFTRLGANKRRVQGGSGLGLTMVRTVIEQHGGQVGVDDNDGGGALFYFDLPKIVE